MYTLPRTWYEHTASSEITRLVFETLDGFAGEKKSWIVPAMIHLSGCLKFEYAYL